MTWIQPIYDRTIENVNSLKDLAYDISSIGWSNIEHNQRSQWLLGTDELNLIGGSNIISTVDLLDLTVGTGIIKGALNYFDVNRIQDNIVYIRDYLNSIGFSIVIDNTNPTWTITSLPFLSNLNRIRSNVEILKNAWYIFSTAPNIEYNNPANYDDINDIERNLSDMYEVILLWEVRYIEYCGQIITGSALPL